MLLKCLSPAVFYLGGVILHPNEIPWEDHLILWAMSSSCRYPLESAYLSFISNISWGEQDEINYFYAMASYLKLRGSNGLCFHSSPEVLKTQDQQVADSRCVNLLAEVVLLMSVIKKKPSKNPL